MPSLSFAIFLFPLTHLHTHSHTTYTHTQPGRGQKEEGCKREKERREKEGKGGRIEYILYESIFQVVEVDSLHLYSLTVWKDTNVN